MTGTPRSLANQVEVVTCLKPLLSIKNPKETRKLEIMSKRLVNILSKKKKTKDKKKIPCNLKLMRSKEHPAAKTCCNCKGSGDV